MIEKSVLNSSRTLRSEKPEGNVDPEEVLAPLRDTHNISNSATDPIFGLNR